MAIPVVDLQDFLCNDAAKKAAFVDQLGKAYEDIGFVAVKNHGVPSHLIAELYEYVVGPEARLWPLITTER